VASSSTVALYGLWKFTRPSSVIHFERGMDRSVTSRSSGRCSSSACRRRAGHRDERRRRADAALHRSLEQSAAAQAAYAVCYTQLFSLITWTSNGLLGARATIAGQNLGAGNADRAVEGVRVASRIGFGVAAVVGCHVRDRAAPAAGDLRHEGSGRAGARAATALLLSFSGLFITVALSYTGGLQGTGDTRSPLYISVISQVIIPLGLCTIFQATRGLQPADIWMAIVIGHMTRCTLSWMRFRQGKWRSIRVDIEHARP
jgi:Na+-driven multidrug efflux pump